MYKRNPPGLLSQSSLEPALPATPTRATHETSNKSLSQNLSMDFRGKGMNLIASLVCLPSLMATPFPGIVNCNLLPGPSLEVETKSIFWYYGEPSQNATQILL